MHVGGICILEYVAKGTCVAQRLGNAHCPAMLAGNCVGGRGQVVDIKLICGVAGGLSVVTLVAVVGSLYFRRRLKSHRASLDF